MWTTNAKDMAFGIFDFIASKPNFINQLLDLSSSNANTINTSQILTCVINPCHHQTFFMFKPFIIFRKDKHLYTMVDINIQNRATICLVIDTLKVC
jgi:hypothetical protein